MNERDLTCSAGSTPTRGIDWGLASGVSPMAGDRTERSLTFKVHDDADPPTDTVDPWRKCHAEASG